MDLNEQDNNRKGLFKKVRKKRTLKAIVSGSKLTTRIILSLVIIVCAAIIGLYCYNVAIQEAKNEAIRIEAEKEAEEKKRIETEKKAKEEAERQAQAEEEKKDDIDREYTSSYDFDTLHETNKDIYAWIKIPGTNVDYPILQSAEDMEEDYYLDHNLDGSRGYPGCIYTQKFNSRSFSDPDTILYGHNMKNGSIFATLLNYKDEAFFEENPYVYVYTPEQEMIYVVYAAYPYGEALIPYYFNYFEKPADLDNYLYEISLYGEDASGNIRTDIVPGESAHILTLSTCNANDNGRYLIQCVLIDYLGEGDITEKDLTPFKDGNQPERSIYLGND